MILPYEAPGAIHTAGLEIPLDRYIDLLFNSQAFSIEGTINYSSPDRTVVYSGSYDTQYFTGPKTYDVLAGGVPAMNAGTRRVCYDQDGGSPLRLHDPGEYLMASGDKVIAAWMTWVGAITTQVTDAFGTTSGTQQRAFTLPCFNYPLEWGFDPTTITSGVKAGATASSELWRIFVQGAYGCAMSVPEAFFGSMQNFDSSSIDAPTAKLVIDGDEFSFVNAGPPSAPFGGTFSHGDITITRSATW